VSIIADPEARANRATTMLQASRLYADLDAELALNPDLPAGYEAKAEDALTILRDRFPGVADKVNDVTEDGYFPKLSTPAKDAMTDVNPAAKKEPGASRGSAGPPRGSTSRPRGAQPRHLGTLGFPTRRRRGRGGVRQVLSPAGQVPGVQTASQLGMRVLLGVVGLSGLYLLVNEQGNGPRAVGLTLGATSNALHSLISPHGDPLRPGAHRAAAAAAAPQGDQGGIPASNVPAPAATPTQVAKLNPAFGPAPGIAPPSFPGLAVGLAPALPVHVRRPPGRGRVAAQKAR